MMTPSLLFANAMMPVMEFVKHASDGRNVPKWRTKILVFSCNSEKIKLGETCFLRYYKGDEYVRPHSEVSHRDEFLSCTACYKLRRFELRTWDACWTYYDAAARDVIPSNERSLRTHGGCCRNSKCKGYEHCVCFGCQMCRFEDCGCQVCADNSASSHN
ncbi:putative developmental regulator, ULTRAPETALA [Helianthus annuus]|uniref:Developmental regulator, ULTRAPETALA n=1 Tax=Helianthus annuus TaxID=4232 RepID=A0A9K3J1F5_HELAN|nr:putative developmental regulator, ULTRAPETALA [Helianthus annuus]KAJ0585354.1 putative developmental regulator, ULTRAPETALA [Helianthus annuus]KAJ0919875.1 putative developmental regulator, ULTRAPETALA [Helianthus annuus]